MKLKSLFQSTCTFDVNTSSQRVVRIYCLAEGIKKATELVELYILEKGWKDKIIIQGIYLNAIPKCCNRNETYSELVIDEHNNLNYIYAIEGLMKIDENGNKLEDSGVYVKCISSSLTNAIKLFENHYNNFISYIQLLSIAESKNTDEYANAIYIDNV